MTSTGPLESGPSRHLLGKETVNWSYWSLEHVTLRSSNMACWNIPPKMEVSWKIINGGFSIASHVWWHRRVEHIRTCWNHWMFGTARPKGLRWWDLRLNKRRVALVPCFSGWWFEPLWKISKSVGMMKFPIYGKIKLIFQTTNQFFIWRFPRNGAIPIRMD